MARYRVMHRYASSTFGPWVEGDHVELDAEEAAWVNHDSEGTLRLVDPQEQARQKREAQEASERKRLGTEKEEKKETPPEEKPEETPPPATKRRGRPPGSGTKRSTT